MTNGTKSLKIL